MINIVEIYQQNTEKSEARVAQRLNDIKAAQKNLIVQIERHTNNDDQRKYAISHANEAALLSAISIVGKEHPVFELYGKELRALTHIADLLMSTLPKVEFAPYENPAPGLAVGEYVIEGTIIGFRNEDGSFSARMTDEQIAEGLRVNEERHAAVEEKAAPNSGAPSSKDQTPASSKEGSSSAESTSTPGSEKAPEVEGAKAPAAKKKASKKKS